MLLLQRAEKEIVGHACINEDDARGICCESFEPLVSIDHFFFFLWKMFKVLLVKF